MHFLMAVEYVQGTALSRSMCELTGAGWGRSSFMSPFSADVEATLTVRVIEQCSRN